MTSPEEEYSNMYEEDKEEGERSLMPPPPSQLPPPSPPGSIPQPSSTTLLSPLSSSTASVPLSIQYPKLYKVITQEDSKRNQDHNGNVVGSGTNISGFFSPPRNMALNQNHLLRPRVGSLDTKLARPTSTMNYLHTNNNNTEPNPNRAQSLMHIPTWQLYFRNEYLLNGSPLFQDAEVMPETEDPVLNSKVSFWYGDICSLEVDAIVNSTTSYFGGQTGVDLAIHSSAGPELREKLKELGPCEMGDIRITNGYKLPAKYIIHTVAPIDKNVDVLKSCYTRPLILLRQHGLKTIAFPCIGTGLKGFPRVEAARIALNSVRVFLEYEKSHLDRIVFCVHNKPNTQIYVRFLQTYFPSSR